VHQRPVSFYGTRQSLVTIDMPRSPPCAKQYSKGTVEKSSKRGPDNALEKVWSVYIAGGAPDERRRTQPESSCEGRPLSPHILAFQTNQEFPDRQ